MRPDSMLQTQGKAPGFDVEALSGILGSVSIACWVCVFSPQIVENFRRSSAEGLSIVFIVVWLLGDLFNILGAILQGVLPTMTILAVYYTLADIVLLLQCFYYRGFTLSDVSPTHKETPEQAIVDGNEHEEPDEETPLLARDDSPVRGPNRETAAAFLDRRRSSGSASIRDHINAVDGTHLNPVVPLLTPTRDAPPATATRNHKINSLWQALFNIGALAIVCLAGALGWWLSTRATQSPYQRNDVDDYGYEVKKTEELKYDAWGQVFGYLCAVLYLGSRVPQLMLNYRRKSTEGVSMLFFLFACVGNLTYVLSIFAYEPPCARWNTSIDLTTGEPYGYRLNCQPGQWEEQYSKYIGVNASWLIGSAGTLALDMAIFVQFWQYRGRAPNEGTMTVDSTPSTPTRDE